jgi:hypothetical protein
VHFAFCPLVTKVYLSAGFVSAQVALPLRLRLERGPTSIQNSCRFDICQVTYILFFYNLVQVDSKNFSLGDDQRAAYKLLPSGSNFFPLQQNGPYPNNLLAWA